MERRRRTAREEGGKEYHQRRAEFVAAAASVFREKGYAGATFNDIAERVSADRATVYYYFGGKEELFQEAVHDVVEANLAEVDLICVGEAPADEKLRRIVDLLITSYERAYPHLFVYIQEEAKMVLDSDSDWAREMTCFTRRFERSTIALIKECIERGFFRDDLRADLTANALYGMLNWTYRWFRPGPGLSAAEVGEAFWAIFVEGMAPAAGMRRPGDDRR